MAKIDINKELYEEGLIGNETNDTYSKYDVSIYTQTQEFLELILEYESNLDEDISDKLKLNMVKKYLKTIHTYKRKLIKKIEKLKEHRDCLKDILK